MLDNKIENKALGTFMERFFMDLLFLCMCSIQMFMIVSFEVDLSLSNYQVDESSKHTEDDEQFTREDEIMCSALEEIS